MNKTGYCRSLGEGVDFCSDKLNLRCLVTYRWKNQEGRGQERLSSAGQLWLRHPLGINSDGLSSKPQTGGVSEVSHKGCSTVRGGQRKIS